MCGNLCFPSLLYVNDSLSVRAPVFALEHEPCDPRPHLMKYQLKSYGLREKKYH